MTEMWLILPERKHYCYLYCYDNISDVCYVQKTRLMVRLSRLHLGQVSTSTNIATVNNSTITATNVTTNTPTTTSATTTITAVSVTRRLE